ncbi:MAG: DUF551 domain-containing protein [Clostridium sulfidigenes]|uniref:DUF551 domain-containing protein n=1 Tax=Clostridium sulfidigenes TaxID=318464 RepID=A0A927ZKG5_9CLOT|nr:DUF551 domain-containing protein [Clostridium sulfidigenes]
MNKQEIEKAIEYFRAGNFLGKSMDKHINVAISALEQQLNNGWIPDIMKEVLREEITDIILSNPDEFKKWLERGIWNCKRLNELSNCKNVWIPVSERLPEENGHYLVTYHEWSKGEYLPEFDFAREKILRFYRGEFRMPVCCNDKIEQDIGREVLAWRPLPEPWRDEQWDMLSI